VVRGEHESGEPGVRAPEAVVDASWLACDELVGHEDVPAYVKACAEAIEESR
jgi:hypothetical protein